MCMRAAVYIRCKGGYIDIVIYCMRRCIELHYMEADRQRPNMQTHGRGVPWSDDSMLQRIFMLGACLANSMVHGCSIGSYGCSHAWRFMIHRPKSFWSPMTWRSSGWSSCIPNVLSCFSCHVHRCNGIQLTPENAHEIHWNSKACSWLY